MAAGGGGRGLSDLPQSIAILPFLANVLPMAWFYDADIFIPELDQDFYDCIEAVKAGMQRRHPKAKLGGRVIPGKIVKNDVKGSKNSISLFSGGVDATFTAVENIKENPILTTVWGADIYLKQEKEWEEISRQNNETARKMGLDYSFVKSSFRSFLNNAVLQNEFSVPYGMDSWWRGVQHGVALVTMVAPLAWAKKAKHIYIASSYSVGDDQSTKCGSWPDIDGNVKYAGLSVTHHDFDVSRQGKIESICKFHKTNKWPMNVRVCWQAISAVNCCACEKCARTIYAILAEGGDPNNFGFQCDDEVYNKLELLIRDKKIHVSSYWADIVKRLKTNIPGWQEVGHMATMVSVYEKTVS